MAILVFTLLGLGLSPKYLFHLPANVPQQAVCSQTKRNSSLDAVLQETLGVGGKTEEPHQNLHISQNNNQVILGVPNPQHERGHPEGFVPEVPAFKKPQKRCRWHNPAPRARRSGVTLGFHSCGTSSTIKT